MLKKVWKEKQRDHCRRLLQEIYIDNVRIRIAEPRNAIAHPVLAFEWTVGSGLDAVFHDLAFDEHILRRSLTRQCHANIVINISSAFYLPGASILFHSRMLQSREHFRVFTNDVHPHLSFSSAVGTHNNLNNYCSSRDEILDRVNSQAVR